MIQAVHEYIVNINNCFSDNIVTEKGTKLFVDKRFTTGRNANIIHKVVNIPMKNKTQEIEIGTEIVIDPIILHQLINQEGTTIDNYNNDIDNFFRVPLNCVFFYKDKNGDWTSPNNYVLAKKTEIEQVDEMTGLIYLSETSKKKYDQNKVLICSNSKGNKNLKTGTLGVTDINLAATYWLDNVEYLLFKEFHFFAIN